MTTNSRAGSRGGNRGRGGRNNNPEGRNQYSGILSSARDNPLTTAAAVGGAVAAGVFLWSRRNQISDQIGYLADQIGEWRDGIGSSNDFTAEPTSSAEGLISSSNSGKVRNQAELSEEALTLKEIGKSA